MTERKRACQDMANEGTESIQPEVPHLGEAGYFCIELFCGSGNLTYAMKHFFPRIALVWIIKLASRELKRFALT